MQTQVSTPAEAGLARRSACAGVETAMSLDWGEAGLIPVSRHTLSESQGTPLTTCSFMHFPVCRRRLLHSPPTTSRRALPMMPRMQYRPGKHEWYSSIPSCLYKCKAGICRLSKEATGQQSRDSREDGIPAKPEKALWEENAGLWGEASSALSS